MGLDYVSMQELDLCLGPNFLVTDPAFPSVVTKGLPAGLAVVWGPPDD